MSDEDAELEAIRRRVMAEIIAQQQKPQVPMGLQVTDDASLSLLITDNPVVAVDCWADWCQPCKTMDPRFVRASERLAGQAVFAKLDVDKNPKSAQAFQVKSIPTILLFKGGRLVDRIVGVTAEAELESRIRRLL